MSRSISAEPSLVSDNRNIRYVGRHMPAARLLLAAQSAIQRTGSALPPDLGTPSDYDYAQIDANLVVETRLPNADMGPMPPVGVGYGGLLPHWRGRYLQWLEHPGEPAPAVFHELYVANIECALLEDAVQVHADLELPPPDDLELRLDHLRELAALSTWSGRGALLLARAQALGRFLTAALDEWEEWWCAPGTPAAVREVALSLQAQMREPLDAQQLATAALDWGLVREPVSPSLALMRLDDLRGRLGEEPLQWALAQVGAAGATPLPWRTAHRDLRLLVPQPAMRPLLEPIFAEAFGAVDSEALGSVTVAGGARPAGEAADPAADPAAAANAVARPSRGASRRKQGDYSLVLEFGHSRSEFYDFAVEIAQRQSSYVALLDENRRLVHRVVLGRTQMRTFWRLWDYVQNWADTRVYVNGVLLEKWKIWPWSHYLLAE